MQSLDKIFTEIDFVVDDLMVCGMQNYLHLFERLNSLLSKPELDSLFHDLSNNLNLDAFIEKSYQTGGAMAGTEHLLWSVDNNERLGMKWLLIKSLASNEHAAIDIAHTFYYVSKGDIPSYIHNMTSQLIKPFIRDLKFYIGNRMIETNELNQPNKVFIVHGHDNEMKLDVARFLERQNIKAIILHEQPNLGSPTIIEKFERHSDVGFAVVLFTPDDEGRVAKSDKETMLSSRARQNVIFELGFFFAKLGRERVCVLKRKEMEFPSDIQGVFYTEYNGNDKWKSELARSLSNVGFEIDWEKVLS